MEVRGKTGESKRDQKRERVDLDFLFDLQERVYPLWLALSHENQPTAALGQSECEHQEDSSSQCHDSKQEMSQLQNHSTI